MRLRGTRHDPTISNSGGPASRCANMSCRIGIVRGHNPATRAACPKGYPSPFMSPLAGHEASLASLAGPCSDGCHSIRAVKDGPGACGGFVASTRNILGFGEKISCGKTPIQAFPDLDLAVPRLGFMVNAAPPWSAPAGAGGGAEKSSKQGFERSLSAIH